MASDTLPAFDLSEQRAPADPLEPPAYGHRERVAWRKLGSPAHFHFYAWRCDDADGVMLTGCVVSRLHTKGKNKGRPDYRSGKAMNVTVTRAEHDSERAAYSAESGLCWECLGAGQVQCEWPGPKFRECSECRGSGKATEGSSHV